MFKPFSDSTIVSVAGITVSHAPNFLHASIFSLMILCVTNGRTESCVTITVSSSRLPAASINETAFIMVSFLVSPPSITAILFSAAAIYFLTRFFVYSTHFSGQRMIIFSSSVQARNFSAVYMIIGLFFTVKYCLGFSPPIREPTPPARITP